jgi:predicted ATPase
MINNVEITNFKSHKETKIDLKNLTLLCGQNGVGKSSFIQSLLLLRQSHLKGKLQEHLSLNKPLCNIGKTKDALYLLNDGDNKNEIIIKINTINWRFDASEEFDFLKKINDDINLEDYNSISLFTNNFQYISALRGTSFESDDFEIHLNKQISLNEGKSELTAQFLYEYGKNIIVNEKLFHPLENDKYLLNQVSAWEKEISKGINVIPVKIGNEFDIKYTFDIPNYGPTQEFSSTNVGFGISYSLPIIVAILSAQKGALIIIENPEAHLHPAGIAKLTELIGIAAEAGIQIIIETHSDHIINGILVQSKLYEDSGRGIDKSNVSIYQFDRDENEHYTKAIEIHIENDGKLKNQPTGFFDQIEIDLEKLMGF